jgi:hypothetical protein
VEQGDPPGAAASFPNDLFEETTMKTTSRSLLRLAGATLAVGAVGLGQLAGPSNAGIAPPPAEPPTDLVATVSPDPSTPGAALTITPEDLCPDGDTLFWSIDGNDVDFSEGDSEAVDDGGHWTVETTADAEGSYTFEGDCYGTEAPKASVGPAGFNELFGSYTVEFTVADATELDPFQAVLDKSSGQAGDDIELSGIACFGDSGAAVFMPAGPTPDFAADLPGLQQYDVLENQFGGVVPVPADTEPGTYQVVTWCLEGGAPNADPVVLAYTVLAPGAVPVEAPAPFTG